jgi:hypothetical protein
MLANLRALFGVVIDIVLLRRGPEHLPASQALLAIAFALSVLASAFLGVSLGLSMPVALLQSLVGSIVMFMWFQVGLGMAGKRERVPQTMTALFIINALFVPPLIPLLTAVLPYVQNPDPASPPPGGPMFAITAIGFWALVVEVRVVRAAFEFLSLGRFAWVGAVLVVLGEFFAAAVIGSLLFGAPEKPV